MRGHLCALAVAFAVALTVSGCGSGDAEPESGSEQSDPGASADTSYFVRADTDAINGAAVQAQRTGARAQSTKDQAACNKASGKGYEEWRTCWHNLLDPFETALTDLAAELETLAKRDFPDDCVASLDAAEAAFTGFASEVEGLLAGIDSKRRAAQVRALRIYGATLKEISKSFAEPFQTVTQVCYSPKDLASINASPSPSPRSSPSNNP